MKNTFPNAKELISSELPVAKRSKLLPIFENGARAINDFVTENGGFFNSPFAGNITGRLYTYLIYRQFEPDMISSNFPFIPQPVKVNNFGYNTLNISSGGITLNVIKTLNAPDLPPESSFRRQSCSNNHFDKQRRLFLDIDDSENALIITPKNYYGFLTYNYFKGKLTHLNLIIPDNKMKSILFNADLTKELALYENRETDQPKEEIITQLKQEIQKKLNPKRVEQGEKE